MEQLYYHGDIITMENEQDHPESIFVRNGIIAAVGTLEEMKQLAGPDTEMIDLNGHTLMPSFIDAHGHVSLTTDGTTMADLSVAKSFDDVVRILKEFQEANRIPEGEPIFGSGYDHTFLKEFAHPTREVLDRVSAVSPICIWHNSQHMCVINSPLLDLMGITEESEDPKGGTIGRAEGDKRPSGYLEESATFPLRRYQMQFPGNLEQQIYDGQMVYARQGITTVQDGATIINSFRSLKKMANEGRLFLDIVSYISLMIEEVDDILDQNEDRIDHYINHFKIGGVKAVLDGSPQGKSAWMTKPYENSGDYCGYRWMKDDVLIPSYRKSLDRNLQILTHCNGDAAADQMLDAYEKAYRESMNPYKEKLRPVMIHCQTVRDDQLDRMPDLHMIPSIFVDHVNFWGDIHLQNLGEARAHHISPVKAAMDRNLVYNFHTDTPVIQPNLLHTVWTAVNRLTSGGVVLGEDQKISAFDALKGITINAAFEYGEETTKGSIKPGKRADLVILSENPLKIDPMMIKDITVLQTIKDGNTVYQA